VDGFHTKTRDASPYALHSLSALLRVRQERHFTPMGQVSALSAQNIQHFMSNSAGEARFVLWQVQREIARPPGLEARGILLLDESADEKSSAKTVGAARQYNGRLAKCTGSRWAPS
jgi:SRSO17 transposase